MLKLTSTVIVSILGFSLCANYSELLKGTQFDSSNLSRTSLPLRKQDECTIKVPKVEVLCENIFDIIVRRRKCISNSINTRICKKPIRPFGCGAPRRYVELTLKYIKSKVPAYDFKVYGDQMEKILTIIAQNLNGTPNEFALFTASALHNTSYFKVFETHQKMTYKSRGLLMIRDEANYKKLNEIGLPFSVDYLRNPDYLAKVNVVNIVNTIRFWKKIMPRKAKLTFEDMMKALKTVAWQKYASGKDKKMDCEIKYRKEIYVDLLDIYTQ